jgi:uncharacterized membrane protein
MLAGDADRERVAEVLKDAFAEGRLTQGEYEERVDRLYRARTYRELDLLVSDVPRPRPPAPAAPPGTNQYAVASLVCGVAGLLMVLPAVPAVVLGHMSRRQIRRTGEQGDGLAVAGLVLGYVVSAVTLALIALVVVLAVVLAHDTG